MRADVIHGNCAEVLRAMASDSVDALVTDPPAGVAFMNKSWDRPDAFGVSGDDVDPRLRDREAFVSFLAGVLSECHRVMKPGAYGVVWSLPRTSHWTALALERAGFERIGQACQVYGVGFPKSLAVDKAIDAHLFGVWLAAHPEQRARRDKLLAWAKKRAKRRQWEKVINRAFRRLAGMEREVVGGGVLVTMPATDAARQWVGWGTALKPAYERWWVIRKAGPSRDRQSPVEAGPPFLYVAKADRSDREAGLAHRERQNVNDGRTTSIDNPYQRGDTKRQNTHPTVKSTELMRWLVGLVSRPGDLVLDPFTGSGSTGVACAIDDRLFIGIEQDATYIEIARNRIAKAAEDAGGLSAEAAEWRRRETGAPAQIGLFAGVPR